MAAKSITSANAIITLAITDLFPVPQQLQGFAADNIYDAGTQDIVETAMGVDGILSGGFVYNPTEQTFSLQADSDSNTLFEQWAAAQKTQKDVYTAMGRTTLPSLKQQWVMTKGFLVNMPFIPSAARTLQPRRYVIRWESVVPQPLGT